jgi:hypothetical protein
VSRLNAVRNSKLTAGGSAARQQWVAASFILNKVCDVANGTKLTFVFAPRMSAFGSKAAMALGGFYEH